MNYAWEAALNADHLNIPREQLQFIPSRHCSPYTEASFEHLNTERIESQKVEVNPLYRFSRIFERLFDLNITDYQQTRAVVFQCLMQYFIQLDLREGLSKQEYYLKFLLQDITGGVFGNQARQALERFEERQIKPLLMLILKLYQCGDSEALLRQAIRLIYPQSLVYARAVENREVLIYIGTEETETEQFKIRFLLSVFLPFHVEAYLFWEYHFGIIDIEDTMKLDQMMIF